MEKKHALRLFYAFVFSKKIKIKYSQQYDQSCIIIFYNFFIPNNN
jgi:regulation of enolase protein 1 (concanavalin A-like superfamily)